MIAGWSSPAARQAHNLKVVGSNPTPATNMKLRNSNELRSFSFWDMLIFPMPCIQSFLLFNNHSIYICSCFDNLVTINMSCLETSKTKAATRLSFGFCTFKHFRCFPNGTYHSTFTSMTVASLVWVTVTPSRWTAILPSARPARGGSENVI